MSKYEYVNVEIVSNIRETEDVFSLTVKYHYDKEILPGQFFMLRVGNKNAYDPFLSRPISVGYYEKGNLTFFYRVVGKGTKLLTLLKKGDLLELMGPLGNSFSISSDIPAIIIGGGIGVAPLIPLVKIYKDRGLEYIFLCGFKNEKEVFAKDILEGFDAKIILEDEEGFVTNHIPSDKEYAMFACGPSQMYGTLKRKFPSKNIEVSLETRMGCGYGVCMGCNVPAKKGGYFSVCKQGPVFNILDLGEI